MDADNNEVFPMELATVILIDAQDGGSEGISVTSERREALASLNILVEGEQLSFSTV